MANLNPELEISRCPHCRVDQPSVKAVWECETTSHSGLRKRFWGIYVCRRCGGLVTCASDTKNGRVLEQFPQIGSMDNETSIPQRAREYLSQSLNSKHAPAGAVMLAAS